MTTAVFMLSAPSGAASGLARTLGAGLRLVAALGLAGAITFSLFMVMQALIASDSAPAAEVDEAPTITISFEVPERDAVRDQRRPTLDPVVAPPPRPVITTEREARPVETGYTVQPPVIDDQVVMDGTADFVLAPPPLATRVEPIYPSREASRGVQGDCTVRYDILASGRTANLSVVSCDSSGFERASLEAVSGWRHSAARGQDPNAVVRRGVTTTLAFRLED
ncbi:MAG: energy transducer TonB [Alphaproteobacteria bacterium]|nr:energy transducer TonB [Alphaproteobacteria bacterium]